MSDEEFPKGGLSILIGKSPQEHLGFLPGWVAHLGLNLATLRAEFLDSEGNLLKECAVDFTGPQTGPPDDYSGLKMFLAMETLPLSFGDLLKAGLYVRLRDVPTPSDEYFRIIGHVPLPPEGA